MEEKNVNGFSKMSFCNKSRVTILFTKIFTIIKITNCKW